MSKPTSAKTKLDAAMRHLRAITGADESAKGDARVVEQCGIGYNRFNQWSAQNSQVHLNAAIAAARHWVEENT